MYGQTAVHDVLETCDLLGSNRFLLSEVPGAHRCLLDRIQIAASGACGQRSAARPATLKETAMRRSLERRYEAAVPSRPLSLGDRHVDDPSAVVGEDNEDEEPLNVTVGTTERSAAMI